MTMHAGDARGSACPRALARLLADARAVPVLLALSALLDRRSLLGPALAVYALAIRVAAAEQHDVVEQRPARTRGSWLPLAEPLPCGCA